MNTRTRVVIGMVVFLLVILLSGCSSPEQQPTPTPASEPDVVASPTSAATPESTPDTPAEDAWARIQSSGVLLVGTAADYPPFEYYNENFQLDGFDIALIRAIGEELGVRVQIQDIAFDGLGHALFVEQIDVAISALSITPEREALADFSNVYYIGEDAVLAGEEAGIGSVSRAEDMAGYTVGVQQRSVYENWARTELVEPGLIAEQDLQVYGSAEQAVGALAQGRVDLVILDALPAQVATSYFDVKIVGQGLNRQRFVIAHLQDQPALQEQLNQALTRLQNAGTLADLADEYLNLSELPPLEPAEPVEPAPEPPCVDSMVFVDDLNLDDQNMTTPPVMAPNQAFRKGWRVENRGTCTWDSSYQLAYVTGNVSAARMGGSAVPVQGSVAPGQSYDFWADLVSPATPGIYQGFWEMRNGAGAGFGQRVWVGIQVQAPSTPVPAPTQTPSPSVSFSANTTTIQQGECVVFSWSVQNIQAVWFYPSGADFANFPTTGQGSSTECPSETTTYNLRIQYRDGSVDVRQITITVIPSTRAPVITSFSASPPAVNLGQCVQVSWQVEGSVSTVTLRRDGIILWSGAPLSGTLTDCPTATGFAIYVVEASGPGGSARLQQNVSVLE